MPNIGRPITCHCMTCKTCYNRIKRRAWVAKNREAERVQNAKHTRSRVQRLKDDPVAYAAYRERRNAQRRNHSDRVAVQAKRNAEAAGVLTITDLGEDRLYSFAEWIATFGPIGSHGTYFHPLIR